MPYSTSIFLEMSRQVISMVICPLGYPIDQWFDEVVFGFLVVFVSVSL